jgi:hypothetical protein
MLSEELKKNFLGSSRERLIETLEISHSSGLHYYLCKFPENLNLKIEDGTTQLFTPSNFIVDLPEYSENGILSMNIGFATVGFQYTKEIENIIRTSNEKIQVKYRFYMEGAYGYPQTESPFLIHVSGINISNKTLSITGTLLTSIQKKVPNKLYSIERFRSLKYL